VEQRFGASLKAYFRDGFTRRGSLFDPAARMALGGAALQRCIKGPISEAALAAAVRCLILQHQVAFDPRGTGSQQ